MRLIDADELKNLIKEKLIDYGVVFGEKMPEDIKATLKRNLLVLSEIDNIPTIDAVEVVRCKECMHKYVTGDTTQYYVCDFMDAQFDENGYCSHGKKY